MGHKLCKETLATIDNSKGNAYLLKWVRVTKGFVKEEALRLLRTDAVKETFDLKGREVLTRPLERSYPQDLVKKILAEVQLSSRNTALKKTNRKQLKRFCRSLRLSTLLTWILKRFLWNTGTLLQATIP